MSLFIYVNDQTLNKFKSNFDIILKYYAKTSLFGKRMFHNAVILHHLFYLRNSLDTCQILLETFQ